MTELEELLAIEAIKKLKGRYQRALDANRWDEFAEYLAEDFTVMETGLKEPLVGRDKVIAQCRRSVENYGGWKHHVLLPDIEILSETSAKGSWTITSFEGIYEDEYVKEDGRWKVRRSQVTLSEAQAVDTLRRRGGNSPS